MAEPRDAGPRDAGPRDAGPRDAGPGWGTRGLESSPSAPLAGGARATAAGRRTSPCDRSRCGRSPAAAPEGVMLEPQLAAAITAMTRLSLKPGTQKTVVLIQPDQRGVLRKARLND
jgi:hypothetical protein